MIQENQNKIKVISKNLRYEVIFYYKKLSVIKTVTRSKASVLINEQIRLEKQRAKLLSNSWTTKQKLSSSHNQPTKH